MSIASRRAVLVVLAGSVLLSVSVSRSWSAGSAPEPPTKAQEPAFPATQGKPAGEEKVTAARAQAEKLYAEGYTEVEKAKKELETAGKEKDAEKRFAKALKKFEGALERDPAYYQAWNMVGFCARHTGDLKRAFAAYEKCLTLQPDYDEAHEYLGEAYIQSGDLAKARVELAWLRANDSDEAHELAEKNSKAEGKAAPAGESKGAPAGGSKEAPAAPAEERPAPTPTDTKKVEKAESDESAPATGSTSGESGDASK